MSCVGAEIPTAAILIYRVEVLVQGLIFDLDGVLIYSRDSHRRAFEEVLSSCGIHDFQYTRYAGWRTAEVFHDVMKAHRVPVSPEQVAEYSARKSVRARELLALELPLAPGCVSVLTSFALRYQLALASSGSRASVNAFLAHTELSPVFRSVLSGDDVQHAKPDPELFVQSIRNLSLEPEQCIVVEDAVAGIQAARSAGARAIGMGKQYTRELIDAGAERVVDSLGELARIL